MAGLAQRLVEDKIEKGSLGIYWLAQAGFAFKTPGGKVVFIDPYLSDAVERIAGFKRMMPTPLAPGEAAADLLVCTHEHPDHVDVDVVPVIAKNPNTHFVGSLGCVTEFKKLGVREDRCHLLEEGKQLALAGVVIHGVYADHGDLSPTALGVVLDFDGIRVYHTGDTSYRPEKLQPVIDLRPDVVIPCINGAYGNLNSEEAARLVGLLRPRLAIASHFGMFVEHGGDPASYLAACAQHAPGVQAVVMKPGEQIIFRK